MFSRCFIIGLMLTVLMAVTALADGGFNGTIKRSSGCDCVFPPAGDLVKITPFGGGDVYCEIDCLRDGYTTWACETSTFPPGWYTLIIELGDGSDCYFGVARQVYHGSDWQRVDLVVMGPESTPDGGGD